MNNYFNVFELEQNFDIDKNKLKSQYNKLVKDHHPDNFTTDKGKHLKALENSNTINQAFKILNDDLSRANHILELNNINAFDALDTKMSPDFLITQIELQEQLESLNDELEFDDFLDKIKKLTKNNIDKIRENLAQNNFLVVRNLVRELKFYYQLKSLTESKLDNFI
jgi:molecular chaperone HscB